MLFKIFLLSSRLETETVIPICPPACGQNLFSVSAAVALSQTDVVLPLLLLVCMLRNRRLHWYDFICYNFSPFFLSASPSPFIPGCYIVRS